MLCTKCCFLLRACRFLFVDGRVLLLFADWCRLCICCMRGCLLFVDCCAVVAVPCVLLIVSQSLPFVACCLLRVHLS